MLRKGRVSANGDGEAAEPAAELQEDVNYFTKGFWAVDNGEWRMWSSISAQAAGDAGRSHVLLACWGDNAAMETTMEEGNRQINLSSRI